MSTFTFQNAVDTAEGFKAFHIPRATALRSMAQYGSDAEKAIARVYDNAVEPQEIMPASEPETVEETLEPAAAPNIVAEPEAEPVQPAVQTTVAVMEPEIPFVTVEQEPEVVTTSDPVAPIAEVVPESDEVTDEEIAETAKRFVGLTENHQKAAELLLDEFNISADEAREFAIKALEDRLYEAEQEADRLREATAKARDKELVAQKEADRQFVDNYCLARNKKRPTTPEEYEKYTRLIRVLLEQEEREAAANDIEVEERFPECPVMQGVLSDLARALYPSLPFEFKYFSLVTHWGLMRSGLDTFGMEPHIQPRFYTGLVSQQPNIGKTASINEARNAMKIVQGMVMVQTTDKQPRVCSTPELLTSADSGQFLVEQFVDLAKETKQDYEKGFCLDQSAKALLDPDELADLFEKARTSQGRVSTLFTELLKLHSGNRTGSGTKQDGKKKVENAHLAILAGTTARKYPMLWTGTGGGADGLRSRFISITTNNPPVPPQPLPSNFAAVHAAYERLARLAQLPGQNVQLSKEANVVMNQWWASADSGKDSATRVLEFVKQLLIVLAVTNAPEDHKGTTLTVGPELVEAATKFGDYVIAVRERLNPGDAWTHVQAMENAIIHWSKQHTSKANPGSMRDCRRIIHPERLPGGFGTFKLAWRNCIDTEMLRWVRKDGRSDKYSA